MTTSPTSLHLAHIIDLRVIGGIERMAEALVLASPQHQHSLLVFDRTLHPTLQASLNHLPNVTIYSSKHWGNIRLPKSWRTARRNRLIEKLQPDAVINWSQIVDVSAIKIPVVFYEHGSAWEVFSSEKLTACYANVSHCIAVSQAAKHMLQQHHQVQKPITVVTNTALKQPHLSAQVRCLPTHRPVVFGAAGRLVGRKNFMVLIAAVAALKQQGVEVQLHIAGNGPQKERLDALIVRLGVQEQVKLCGYVQNMAQFYNDIDVFVCPSIWESYGLVAIEAFGHGIPVIAASCDGIVEVVTHGVNGFLVAPTWNEALYAQALRLDSVSFDATVSYDTQRQELSAAKSMSVDDLSRAMLSILHDVDAYGAMSQAALQTAVDIKPFEQLVAEVLASVKEAIDG